MASEQGAAAAGRTGPAAGAAPTVRCYLPIRPGTNGCCGCLVSTCGTDFAGTAWNAADHRVQPTRLSVQPVPDAKDQRPALAGQSAASRQALDAWPDHASLAEDLRPDYQRFAR